MLDWLRKKAVALPKKNPSDYTLTASSTPWTAEYYCDMCFSTLSQDELMTDICCSCGGHATRWPYMFHNNKRSTREISDGSSWVTQKQYGRLDQEHNLKGI